MKRTVLPVLLVLGMSVFGAALQVQRSDPFAVIRNAHRATLSGLAFTPDGSRLISTDIGGLIKIWEVPQVRLLRTIEAGGQFLADLLVIAGGNSLVTAGWDASERASAPPSAIVMWDLRTGKRLRTFEGKFLITGVAVDESVLWAQTVSTEFARRPRGEIIAWDLSDGRVIARLNGQRAVISKDRTLALVADENVLEVRDGRTAELKRSIPLAARIADIAALPAGRAVISSGNADAITVEARDLTSGAALWTKTEPRIDAPPFLGGTKLRIGDDPASSVPVLFASPAGEFIVSWPDQGWVTQTKDARAWDPETGQDRVVLHLVGGRVGISSIGPASFLSEGFVAIASQGRVSVVRLATSRVEREMSPGAGSMAVSRDGALLATGTQENIRLWQIAPSPALSSGISAPAPALPEIDPVVSLALSADGRQLAAAVEDDFTRAEIAVISTETGAPLRRKRIDGWSGHGDTSHSVAISPDGMRVARTGDDVRIFDVTTGRQLARAARREEAYMSIAMAATGALVTGIGPLMGGVRVWDAASGRLQRTLAQPAGDGKSLRADGSALAFSHDGNTLAIGTGGGIRLFDARSWTLTRVLTGFEGFVGGIAFSSDDRRVAGVGFDIDTERPIQAMVWQADGSHERRVLAATQGRGVAFTPDGSRLLTATPNGELQAWSTESWEPHAPFGSGLRATGPLAVSPNGLLWSLDADGGLLAWDPVAGRLLVRLVLFHTGADRTRQDGWVASTPDGFYDGSQAADVVMRTFGGGSLSSSEVRIPDRRSPEAVRSALRGNRAPR